MSRTISELQPSALPTNQALKQDYTITCPACHKDSLYSLITALWRPKVNCPSCHESITVADHFRRAELEDIAEKLGHPRNFIAGNER